MSAAPRTPAQRGLASAGAVLAAASVALAAYGAHGNVAGDPAVVQLAAVFTLGHGLALAALAPLAARRLGVLALAALLSGIVLFAGSLLAAQFAEVSPRLAPAGGLLLIAGWALFAIDAARR